MKAWLSHAPGGPDTLTFEDAPQPVPGPGEVLVAVGACGLNFPDLLMMRDGYQFTCPRPFAPGAEVAGTVMMVGGDVSAFSPGDRVVGLCNNGGLAQQAVLLAADTFLLPQEISFESAAAFIFTYGTAYYALKRRGSLREGDKVLVLGAGGGIGLAMTELAVALGATVIAAASDEAKLGLARSKGASSTLIYPRDVHDEAMKALSRALKEPAGPGGYDVIVDPVGGDYSEAALRASGWGARYLVIGFPAGIPRPPLNLALLKGCSIVGVDWYQYGRREMDARAQDIESLYALVRQGRIAPAPSEIVPFADAPNALAHLDSRTAAGKIVVSITA